MRRSLPQKLLQEKFLLVSYGSMVLFLCFMTTWIGMGSGVFLGSFLFLWLFLVMLFSSFAVVRHADFLAENLGEPYGTLILTLSVTSIEIMMIAALMTKGNSPTLARNTMFSVIMIMLGGILGSCLLIGGLRFHEQKFNLKGEKTFMGLILPLSLFSLVLPNFTAGEVGFFTPLHATSAVVLSLILYGMFVATQTYWHQDFFIEPLYSDKEKVIRRARSSTAKQKKLRAILFHIILLVLYIAPIMVLSEKLAFLLNLKEQSIDFFLPKSSRSSIHGLIIAILLLAPEGLAALRAAWHDQMQRSINLLLGSVLATIGLTVPAAIGLGLFSGQPVLLGLKAASITLLAATLGSCMITFSQGETNLMQGAIHIFLFVAYILLMFQ